MKMPDKIEKELFAVCGMNCMVCYKHLSPKNPCPGCREGKTGKPQHCYNCKIKNCADDRNITYCFLCGEFPCKQIYNLEKRYQKRYRVSLIENALLVKQTGMCRFMELQRSIWMCGVCGGVISLHDSACSECMRKI